MKNVLFCPPTHYRVVYEINPWMHEGDTINQEKLWSACNSLKKLYQDLGVQVYEIEMDPELPDMVYTINSGFVVGNSLIKARYRYPQRRKEADRVADYFKNKLNFNIIELPEDVFFEGGGELFKVGEKYFLGWGFRANEKAKSALEKILDAPIIDFHLENPYFYHLDTCFGPLSEKEVIVNPKAFSDRDLQKIHDNFETVIENTSKDNHVMGCNLVMVEKNLITAKGISATTRERISSLGYTIHEIDMSEYIKGGGSVKCVSLGWD